jgi:transposase
MRNLTREECLFAVKEAQKPNKTFSTIARQLHCDRRTISRIVARFNETGLLTEKEKPGRPTSLTEEQQKSLGKYISKNPTATSNQLSSYILDEFDIRVSERTLQRYRRALGFYPRKQQTQVISTPAQIEKRHLFTVEHQNSDLKKWIFIDETQVQLRNTL